MHCTRILHRKPVLFGVWGFALAFVLYPFFWLLTSALKPGAGSMSNALFRVLSSGDTWQAVASSLFMALSATLGTLFCALVLAFLVVRTDMPKSNWVTNTILVSFSIPSYVLALSWIQLTSRNGYMNRVRDFLGFDPLSFSPYSCFAVGVVLAFHMLPIAYFALCNALGRYDQNLESAALLSGAGPLRMIRTVVFPLIFPQLLSIGLLIFARILANFDVPAALALPIGKALLPTKIYAALSSLDLGKSAALSLVLMAFSISVQSLGKRSIQQRHYQSHGQGGEVRKLSLGKWKWPIFCAVFFFLITLIVPFVTLVVSSFLKRWGLSLKPEYLTTANYTALLGSSQAKTAFFNSIFYGVVAVMVAIVIAVQVTYKKESLRSKRVLVRILSLPMATPNMVLAVSAIMAWNHGILHLYGTRWAIIATYTILFIPLVLQNIRGLAQTHDEELIWAARVSGASERKSNRDIAWPIILPGVQSGALLCFIIALREIPISLLLYSSGQETIGILLFGMQSQSYGMEMTSTLAVLVTICIFILRFLLYHSKSQGLSQ